MLTATLENFTGFKADLPLELAYSDTGAPDFLWLPAAPMGQFIHPWYGPLDFSEATFAEWIANFEQNVLQKYIFLDFRHDDGGPAAGIIKKLEYRASDELLWAMAELLPDGKEAYEMRRFHYTSPWWDRSYWDKTLGGDVQAKLFCGLALTNSPFFSEMPAVSMAASAAPGGSRYAQWLLQFPGARAENTQEVVMDPEEKPTGAETAAGAPDPNAAPPATGEQPAAAGASAAAPTTGMTAEQVVKFHALLQKEAADTVAEQLKDLRLTADAGQRAVGPRGLRSLAESIARIPDETLRAEVTAGVRGLVLVPVGEVGQVADAPGLGQAGAALTEDLKAQLKAEKISEETFKRANGLS